jgi:hypothetical protein
MPSTISERSRWHPSHDSRRALQTQMNTRIARARGMEARSTPPPPAPPLDLSTSQDNAQAGPDSRWKKYAHDRPTQTATRAHRRRCYDSRFWCNGASGRAACTLDPKLQVVSHEFVVLEASTLVCLGGAPVSLALHHDIERPCRRGNGRQFACSTQERATIERV